MLRHWTIYPSDSQSSCEHQTFSLNVILRSVITQTIPGYLDINPFYPQNFPKAYCGGIKTFEPRQFANGVPSILPVNVDIVCRNRTLCWDTISKQLELWSGERQVN